MSCECGENALPAFDGETMKCKRCSKVWDDPQDTPQQPLVSKYPEPTAQSIQQTTPKYYEEIEDPELKRRLDNVRTRYNREKQQRKPDTTKQALSWKAYGGWLLSTFLLATVIGLTFELLRIRG